MISEFAARKRFYTIEGRRMAYVDDGVGDPIVFLHGNPTSSFLWRNVMPHLRGRGRLIAPDLIGMGDSEKLEPSGPDRYTYAEQRRYLFALLEALDVRERVTLVIHDWGSALGFDWGRHHPHALKGIAFMEAIVAPMTSWQDLSENVRPVIQAFRSPQGEQMVLEQNLFVERVLPSAILRTLSAEEMEEYRRPFRQPGEARRPMLTWPRQLPIEGQPQDVVEVVGASADWLASSDVPKLFINAEPGAFLQGRLRDQVRGWPNLREVTVKGVHFIQEDSAEDIGRAIATWLDEVELSTRGASRGSMRLINPMGEPDGPLCSSDAETNVQARAREGGVRTHSLPVPTEGSSNAKTASTARRIGVSIARFPVCDSVSWQRCVRKIVASQSLAWSTVTRYVTKSPFTGIQLVEVRTFRKDFGSPVWTISATGSSMRREHNDFGLRFQLACK